MIEDAIARAIRDELKAQRQPIAFDLDQVVRAVAALFEDAIIDGDSEFEFEDDEGAPGAPATA